MYKKKSFRFSSLIVTVFIAFSVFVYFSDSLNQASFSQLLDQTLYTLSIRDQISVQRTLDYYQIQEGEKPSSYQDLLEAGLLEEAHVESLKKRNISFDEIVEADSEKVYLNKLSND